MNYQTIKDMLILDEGLRLHPYKDTAGKLTIGVGRNLDDVGISKDESMFLLHNDLQAVISAMDQLIPWWRGMNNTRQHVLMNMCFNLGINRLLLFKDALAAMEMGNWEKAAQEMQDSKWFEQVAGRGIRLVSLMRHGQ